MNLAVFSGNARKIYIVVRLSCRQLELTPPEVVEVYFYIIHIIMANTYIALLFMFVSISMYNQLFVLSFSFSQIIIVLNLNPLNALG